MYTITIGIDSESASSAAVDWVIHWHRAADARITLVTAFDFLVDELGEDAGHLDREARRLRDALPRATVETALVDGAIRGALERRSQQTDLLVVGSHRTRHLRSVLTGRLSLRIAEHAACPVIIVPDDWRGRNVSIAAGIGDDASSEPAVAFAAAEAADLGIPLHLLHAWSPVTSASEVSSLVVDPVALRSAHGERLAAVARRVRTRCLAVREHLHEGTPGFALTALGAEAALVVVGTHRSGPIGEILLGSTAASLVRDSRTPVCIVPEVWTEPDATRPARFEEAWV